MTPDEAGSGLAGAAASAPRGSRASRAVVRFLAVCNAIGFAVLFGFIGAGNFFLRRRQLLRRPMLR